MSPWAFLGSHHCPGTPHYSRPAVLQWGSRFLAPHPDHWKVFPGSPISRRVPDWLPPVLPPTQDPSLQLWVFHPDTEAPYQSIPLRSSLWVSELCLLCPSQAISISKAINTQEAPVKEKHARRIILGTHHEKGAFTFWSYAIGLPLPSSSILSWKFCHVLHKVLRDGHPNVLHDCQRHRSNIREIGDLWGHLHDRYGQLVNVYTKLLLTKISFHLKHPQFPAGLEVTDEVLEKTAGTDVNNIFQLTVEMFDYMDCELRLSESGLQGRQAIAVSQMSSGQCRLAPLIQVIQDCSHLYHYTVKLLFKLHACLPADTLQGHRDRFHEQFHSLRNFFRRASDMLYFKRLIQIPRLPEGPPNFLRASALAEHIKPVVVIPEEAPEDEEPENLIEISTGPPAGEPVVADLFEQTFGPPNGSLKDDRDMQIETLKREVETLRAELEKIRLEVRVRGQLCGPPPAPQAGGAPTMPSLCCAGPALRVAAEGPGEHAGGRAGGAAEKGLFRSFASVRPLPKERPRPWGGAAALLGPPCPVRVAGGSRVSKLPVGSPLLHQESRERELRQRLLDEQFAVLRGTAAEAERILQDAVAKLDDPLHLRCTSSPDYLVSRAQAALDAMSALEKGHAQYLVSRSDASALVAALTQFSYLAADTIVNGSATSHLAPTDPADRLIDTCRECGARALELMGQLQEQGTPLPDSYGVSAPLTPPCPLPQELKPKSLDVRQEELGAMVDKEMAATSAAIEDAVRRIEDMMNQARHASSGVKLEVNERILNSCTDLMKAIRLLVTTSTSLQKEIVESGRVSGATHWSDRNSRWTEGLISASKAVGWGATQLVESADRVVLHTGKYEELIVCSHEIAASTAQGGAASKVKADKHSPHLSRLQDSLGPLNVAAPRRPGTSHGREKSTGTSPSALPVVLPC
uniref:Huntingtin interacting protein 1 related n=1 Tax=Ursus maritimus TaxID=29073 RepID=A0A452TE99_URSMA